MSVNVAEGLTYIGYGGAPLKKETGDSLVACGMKLCNEYGTYVFEDRQTPLYSHRLFTAQKSVRYLTLFRKNTIEIGNTSNSMTYIASYGFPLTATKI
jgi:hypothetical protein